MLCGCATADRAGTPPLTVDLAALRICERLLLPLKAPAVTADTDARVAWLEADARLAVARGEILNGRNCIADVRRRYAGQKSK